MYFLAVSNEMKMVLLVGIHTEIEKLERESGSCAGHGSHDCTGIEKIVVVRGSGECAF